MAVQIARFVSEKIFKESTKNKFGQEDPYFEQVPASRLHRAFGKKTQKRRKAVPPGLSQNDAKILNRVKRRAYRLDYALFNFCGVSFGWGSVIALIPFAGDGLDAALAFQVARDCEKIDGGLPRRLSGLMFLNVLVDLVIGFVPFIGDFADALYKCNTRNAILLEKYLREKVAKEDKAKLKDQERPPVDLSMPEEFDRYDDELDDLPLDDEDRPSGATANKGNTTAPPKPPPVKVPGHDRRLGEWFGGSRQRQEDIEMRGSQNM